MADVFISYSRRNSDFARRLIDKLILRGKDAWVDWEGIPLTSPNWWMDIKTGIEAADSFVFIMSPDSMASVVCNMELDYAIELRKRIIPVVHLDVVTRDAFASVADFEPDEAMQERLAGKDPLLMARDNWQRLSHINWVFFRATDDFDMSFERLLTTVETDLSYVRSHTRYLTRAQEWTRENQREDLLLFGGEIDRAEAWLKQGETYAAAPAATKSEKVDVVNPLPQDQHRTYIQSSRTAETSRTTRLRTVRRASIIGATVAVVALIFAVGASLVGLQATTNANQAGTQVAKANSALTAVPPTLTAISGKIFKAENRFESLRLAALAKDEFESNNILVSSLLGIRALKTAYTTQADTALIAGLEENPAEIILSGYPHFMLNAVFSPDGTRVITDRGDGATIIWDATTGEHILIHNENYIPIVRSAFSPDSSQIVSARLDGVAIIWDVATGEQLRSLIGHSAAVFSAAFSPDGTQIVTASGDNTAIIWDAMTGKQVHLLAGHTNRVENAAFSPDGTQIVTASGDNTAIIWDAMTGKQIHLLAKHIDGVTSAAFSPDGTQIVTASWDDTAIIWDAATGEQLRFFNGHYNSAVFSVAFSPDGTQIVTAGDDGTAIIWDAATGEQLRFFSAHNYAVRSAAFSPDGKRIVSASEDNTAMIWNTDYHDFIDYACVRIANLRDFADEERTRFGIRDDEPTCPQFAIAPS